jgi:hypothetical protein
MVIHRVWKDMGFKMNSFLAWFITFNFINITWVFFRAKDFTSVEKVLSGMFCLNNIMLPEKYAWLTNIEPQGLKELAPMFFMAIVIVFFLKNSMQKLESFKLNAFYLIFNISILLVALSAQNSVSEFLYFNF